jgi:hypothetical protein
VSASCFRTSTSVMPSSSVMGLLNNALRVGQ